MVAAATIQIMKLAWVTYLGALSRINAILIPRISAHPPILAQCKAHRPWALFSLSRGYSTCKYVGVVMCHTIAYPLLSAYMYSRSVYHYKRMCLLTRVYGNAQKFTSNGNISIHPEQPHTRHVDIAGVAQGQYFTCTRSRKCIKSRTISSVESCLGTVKAIGHQ